MTRNANEPAIITIVDSRNKFKLKCEIEKKQHLHVMGIQSIEDSFSMNKVSVWEFNPTLELQHTVFKEINVVFCLVTILLVEQNGLIVQ